MVKSAFLRTPAATPKAVAGFSASRVAVRLAKLTSPANANVNSPLGRAGAAGRCADADGLVGGRIVPAAAGREDAAECGVPLVRLEQAASMRTKARAAAAARGGGGAQVGARISGYPTTPGRDAVNHPPQAATMRT